MHVVTHKCMTLLINVWNHSYMYDMTHKRESWLILMRSGYELHSCVTWRIDMWHDSFICDMTRSCVTWLIHMWHDALICDMTHSYVTWLINVLHDSFLCSRDIQLIHTWPDALICDMTHSYAQRIFWLQSQGGGRQEQVVKPSSKAKYACVGVFVCVSTYIYILCVHIYTSVRMYVRAFMYTHIYLCVYIPTYTYIYVYVCKHIYMHMHVNPLGGKEAQNVGSQTRENKWWRIQVCVSESSPQWQQTKKRWCCFCVRVSFHKRAVYYRALLRKITYENKASYASSPSCTQKQHQRCALLVCNTLQHTATLCTTLQHSDACSGLATHCKTLQHTAPHIISSVRDTGMPVHEFISSIRDIHLSNSSRQFVIFIYRIHLVHSWYRHAGFTW